MGIVEKVLAEFETCEGTGYRIEYNEGGMIHLHTEHVRLDLNEEEFEELAETVVESRETLSEIKDL